HRPRGEPRPRPPDPREAARPAVGRPLGRPRRRGRPPRPGAARLLPGPPARPARPDPGRIPRRADRRGRRVAGRLRREGGGGPRAIRSLPVIDRPAPRRLPDWLKRPLPAGNGNFFTQTLIHDLRLTTVCEEARCPNRPECWSWRTATFMVLGDVCTRPCGFC